MKNIKRGLSIAIVAAMVLGMTACGGSGTADTKEAGSQAEGASGENAASGDGSEMVVAWWGNQVRNERTQAILELYSEQNPGVTFDGQFSEWADYWNKLATAAAGHSMPDIVQMDYKYIQQYVNNDLLVDLTPYIENGTIDVADCNEDVLNSGKVGDGLYAICNGINAPALLYNKTALDEAGIQYDLDSQNASGDQSACQTVASKFANDKKDLILAIATPAAQAVAGAVTDTPVLITAVTDPAESGLVDDNQKPGGNVTGTSDLTPVKEQIDLLKQILPDAKKVGILYCSAESNSEIQAQMAREAIEAAGMTSQDFTVSSSNEIQTVVQSMVGKVDAIYAPTDNTIAAGMTTVGMVAGDNNLPVICGESGMVDNGGLATYGIDYYQLGYMTGQQAVRILTEGASPADMPIEYLPVEKCELTVNEETAATLGIDVSNLK